MRIAYFLLNHDIKKNDGVVLKVKTQIEEWRSYGHIVKVFCFVTEEGESVLEAKQYPINPVKRYISTNLFLQKEFIEDLIHFNPDMVYFRYGVWNVTLEYLLNRYKSVVEINTYDLGEFLLLFKRQKTVKSALRYLAYRFLRSKILNKVAGIITVTEELAMHTSTIKYNKPKIYIPNNINLDEFKIIKDAGSFNKRIGLFFIGTPKQAWHGVDIIKKMAEHLPEFDFHIVGDEGNSDKNLFYHGYLPRDIYTAVLKKCHICIGSLALHRKGMREACPLKTREYLAYGYPVITGYKDSAFFEKEPDFILNIQDDILSGNINYAKVKNFIENNAKRVVKHEETEYFISSKILEKKRVIFFEMLILSNI